MRSAILFMVFNRPEPTREVFAAIRKAQPPRLYVAADGARAGKPGEAERCEATRQVAAAVDWPCTVKHLFRDQNRGCKLAVSEAIDWFFREEEEGIILEDDCLPDPGFFPFCDEMLERFRFDERVALISGDNFQFGRRHGEASYYFSRYAHIWGWASWRRMWNHYSSDARHWPEFRDGGGLQRVFGSRNAEIKFWSGRIEGVHAGAIDTWDYQLNLAMWRKSMLAVQPQVNLISNIGFGADATHTTGAGKFANMKVEPLRFPLTHPDDVAVNTAADDYTAQQMFSPSLAGRITARINSIVTRLRSGT